MCAGACTFLLLETILYAIFFPVSAISAPTFARLQRMKASAYFITPVLTCNSADKNALEAM